MTETFTATRAQLVDAIACLRVDVATSGPAKGMILAESMADAIIAALPAAGATSALTVQAARIYRDVCALMEDYGDPGRDVIATMPFAASLDQLMFEQYGVTLDGAAPAATPERSPS